MMLQPILITLRSPQETEVFAARLGKLLRAGDTLLLEGLIGAGKTHLARSLIQSRLRVQEDVPSPTFTLVQTYDAGDTEIWHADLYRLSGPEDIVELGLTDAFETAICLIEWPDRLGELQPDTALTLRLGQGETDDMRRLELTWTDPQWDVRLKGLTSDQA
ncbi:MAG: tRNA (adenosine(37)-N6)-threonylcarbamoyltransferase complex ATPase subunit type 1 TsaE [Rhodobacterales bacterium]